MLGERRVHVAAEARPRRGQLGKNARGAPDGRVEGIAAPRRLSGRGCGRRAEAALEVVAEGLPRPVVVLAVASPASGFRGARHRPSHSVDVETRELSRLGAGAQSQVIYL